MIWRIRERSTIARVSREGRRLRAGALWCNCLIDPEASPPRVAFAIGRAVGPSVVRNRVRRQLRAALAAADLPAGWYLIGARPDVVGRSFNDLTSDVTTLAHAAATTRSSHARRAGDSSGS